MNPLKALKAEAAKLYLAAIIPNGVLRNKAGGGVGFCVAVDLTAGAARPQARHERGL